MTKNNEKVIKKIFDEFGGATTQKEFDDFIEEDSQTIPCVVCKRELQISQINWIDSDPYCEDHTGTGEY